MDGGDGVSRVIVDVMGDAPLFLIVDNGLRLTDILRKLRVGCPLLFHQKRKLPAFLAVLLQKAGLFGGVRQIHGKACRRAPFLHGGYPAEIASAVYLKIGFADPAEIRHIVRQFGILFQIGIRPAAVIFQDVQILVCDDDRVEKGQERLLHFIHGHPSLSRATAERMTAM